MKLIADVTVKFNNLYDWCISNKLTINSEKTQFMVFHTPNKPMPNNLSEIDTMRMKIKWVNTIKYLGVIFDEKFKWNNHIDYICDSLIRYFGIFNHLKHKATKLIARQLYYAFIYSKIKYGIEVYGAASTTNMEKLQIMQNTLMKLILKLDMRTSTYYLHSTLKILKVEDIYLCNVVVFGNKCLSGHCPNIFKEYFKIKTSHYANRREGSLEVPTYRIDYGMRSVKVKGAVQWNRLHKNLHQYRFKKCLKRELINYYIKRYMENTNR